MTQPPESRFRSTSTTVAGVVWLLIVLAAMVVITNYSNAPGGPSLSPAQWPAESKIARDSKLPTFVMFAHPHCPCTRASVGELAVFMARCQGRVQAHVLFLEPDITPPDWEHSDLWQSASSIPGVKVAWDRNGAEAKRFGSDTSGHCVLYAPDGKLLFQGGITVARGHWGDSPGLAAVTGQVTGKIVNEVRTPVFGCSLDVMQCEKSDHEPTNQ
jgi:hypothetical protein